MKDKAIQIIDTTDVGEVMDLKIDPIRGDDGKIISGLVVGNTLEQNKALILLAQPCDFKFKPTLGVGIEDFLLEDADLLECRHRIRENFRQDGLKIKDLDLYDINSVKIDAGYE